MATPLVKILLLAPQPFYQERGTPIAVRILAQSLAEMNHEVHLLVFAEGEDVTITGVTIHRIASIPGISNIPPGFSIKKIVCDVFMFFKCIHLVKKYDIQMIHAVEEAAFMAVVMDKIFKVPYVYDMDSCLSEQLADKFAPLRIFSRFMSWFEKTAIVRSKGVVAVCKSLEDMAREVAPGKNIIRLEDISLLGEGEQGQEDLREKLGGKGIMLLYVGNLEPYQGIDLLINGFHEALNVKNDMFLVLIGGTSEHIEIYRKNVKQLGIGSKVFFCGARPVTMLGYYLQQADILVSPRTQGNNTPMKIYSYLDSGVSVLATDLPTHTQVLDEEIAYLVSPDPGAVARGINVLAKSGELRKELGQKARQRVHDEFSLPAYKRKLAEFYGQMAL